ncbi:UNVERIFIED_CONTAM: hypothetical protein FKN15_053835 [Acipenser sinensis]
MEQKVIQQEQQRWLKVAATKEFGHRQDVDPDEDLLWHEGHYQVEDACLALPKDACCSTSPVEPSVTGYEGEVELPLPPPWPGAPLPSSPPEESLLLPSPPKGPLLLPSPPEGPLLLPSPPEGPASPGVIEGSA